MGYQFDFSIIFQPEYFTLIKIGVKNTIKISLVAAILATILGILIAIFRTFPNKFLNLIGAIYVEFFRNTPLLVQLFFWYFGVPDLLPEPILDKFVDLGLEFWAATLGLSIYTSAFIAETIRSGINSIKKGEIEAALAFGFTWSQVFRYIIIPHAMRVVIPPLTSQYLNLVKNSSLAMTVGYEELTFMVQEIESLTFRGFEAAVIATLIYLYFSIVISFISKFLEKKFYIPGLSK